MSRIQFTRELALRERELEERVKHQVPATMAIVRGTVRRHPWLFMGGALVGGLVAGSSLRGPAARHLRTGLHLASNSLWLRSLLSTGAPFDGSDPG